jgi:hypothetical protein
MSPPFSLSWPAPPSRLPIPISPLPLSSTPKPPEPCAAFPSQAPRSSPEHRDSVSHRNLVGAAALLPFLGAPPSEPLLSQSTTLVHLPLFLRTAGCVTDHRGPSEATGVVGAPPSRSSSSALTSLARSGGFPPSLGHSVHSPCNTATLGVGLTAPRAPARRW